MMFQTITPEQAGISSAKVLEFIKALDDHELNTHSIIMARGNDIFAEAYYAPFDADFKHRMYSVSKSFIAIAVGLAEQEGLLSLDDKFMKYFPEYRNANVDAKYEETTIRDMLTMRSCMGKPLDWWGYEDRVQAYFDMTSNQIPGTNFYYDSTGSFLLACIVEKVTGKLFLEYLKEKVLLDIGFSKDSYCLLSPGGHSHSDSGVMCTARDLLTFARFVMNLGEWDGKQYINKDFMQAAISKQADDDETGEISGYANMGYGYLIWKAPRDGFAFVGMADQFAICDPKTDFILIITSENMGSPAATRMLLYHELYKTVIGNLGETLPENEEEYDKLTDYLSNRKMIALNGGIASNVETQISGKTYKLEPNAMGIDSVKVIIRDGIGTLEYTNAEGMNTIKFGMGHNEFSRFPGKKRMSLTASVYKDGDYACGASAIWSEETKLHIMVRVIDTYMGTLSIVLGFKDDRISVRMVRRAQRILNGYHGNAVGKLLKQEVVKL